MSEIIESEVDGTKYVLVMSGKGGVGKSTVASRLATRLSINSSVGLLDVDITTPSIPKLFGLSGESLTANKLINPVKVSDTLCIYSVGLDAPEGQFIAFRGDLTGKIIEEGVYGVAWGNPDYIVLDMPPTTGDELLKVLEILDKKAKAVLVTLPTAVSKVDVVRTVNMLKHYKVDILGVIENFSQLFPGDGGREISDEFGIDFLGKIPFEAEISEENDNGNISASGVFAGPLDDTITAIKGAW